VLKPVVNGVVTPRDVVTGCEIYVIINFVSIP
jgi:hypothetical protein